MRFSLIASLLYILRQDLSLNLELTGYPESPGESSCLYIFSTGITGVCQYVQLLDTHVCTANSLPMESPAQPSSGFSREVKHKHLGEISPFKAFGSRRNPNTEDLLGVD